MITRKVRQFNIYVKYRKKIYSYFWYRIGFNDSGAEDLTAEVFMRMVKYFNTYDAERPAGAWVYGIARNVLCNHYRTLGREIDLEAIPEPSSDQIMAVNNELDTEKLLEQIDKLSLYHKDVLLLRFVDQLSNKEIAEVLGKKEIAVRVQISRAINELRQICGEL